MFFFSNLIIGKKKKTSNTSKLSYKNLGLLGFAQKRETFDDIYSNRNLGKIKIFKNPYYAGICSIVFYICNFSK